MNRATVLSALVIVGLASAVTSGRQQPAGDKPKVIEVEKLKDNFFVLRGAGGGGNTAVFVASKGVVVVDTKNPGWGQPILDKIKELTDKPITTDHQHPYPRRSRERQRRVPDVRSRSSRTRTRRRA